MARNGRRDNDYRYSRFCNDHDHEDDQLDRLLGNTKSRSKCAISSPLPPSSAAFRTLSPPPVSGVGYIEHPVSKMDTLAGVAIKYGVEVADIKRMNGLVTDLQMFALKSLQIPLPGRHPPSHSLSSDADTPGQNNSERAPLNHGSCDLIPSFQPLRSKSPALNVSTAMLQGFYGIKPADPNITSAGLNGDSPSLRDGSYLEPSPACNLPLSRHRKSKSLVNGFLPDSNEAHSNLYLGDATADDSDKVNEKLVRRRPKSVTDFTSPEILMREENNTGPVLSAITGKGLAQRPKAATRFSIQTDADAGDAATPVQIGVTGSFAADGISGFRKSSSTSNLQEEDSPGIWPTYWKPDLQALSAAAISKPIFDGLPRPVSSRRNKAALD